MSDQPTPPTPGRFIVATMLHSDWCPTIQTNRTGDCRCSPTMEYRDFTDDVAGAARQIADGERRRKAIGERLGN